MSIPTVRARALIMVMAGLSVAAVSCARGAAQTQAPSPLNDPELMRAQREVWDVWFAGDTARLRELTPGLITLEGGASVFGAQDDAVRGSAGFHDAGGRLLELTFPAMRAQRFGDVVVIYSSYRLLMLVGADTTRREGRATEVFVKQNGHWVNPGWHLAFNPQPW